MDYWEYLSNQQFDIHFTFPRRQNFVVSVKQKTVASGDCFIICYFCRYIKPRVSCNRLNGLHCLDFCDYTDGNRPVYQLQFCPGDCDHQIVQERIEEDFRKESLYWKQIPEKLIVSKRPAKLIIQFSLWNWISSVDHKCSRVVGCERFVLHHTVRFPRICPK